jgi:hypothetical protein
MLGSPYREALGLVVLIAITAAIWVAPRLAKKYPPDVGGGIGGWLVIVGIGVCITPLYPAAETIQALGQNKWGTVVLGTLVTIWAVVNAVLFFQRKRHFPKAYIGLLVVLSVSFVTISASSSVRVGLTQERHRPDLLEVGRDRVHPSVAAGQGHLRPVG